MKSLLCDLFKGVGGKSWELARFAAAWAILTYSGAFLYSVARGATIDWTSLGLGYAAVLAGAATFIGIKDVARAKSLPAENANSASGDAG